VTTTSATGAYTQIGNVVTFTVTIAYNSSVVPTGGSVTMDLPRPSATGFNQRPGTWAFNAWNGAAGTFFLSIGSNSSTATLRVANGTGTSATYQWWLQDAERANLTTGTITLTGEAYAAWGTDDEYLYTYTAQQLGLTIVEIVPDAPAIIAPPLPDMSVPPEAQ
jgi:hypothetical protein